MLLSIIVPVYNNEKYLRDCVDSLICQNMDDCEIILIDDGSSDSSPTICDEYRNNHIRVIHKENQGLAETRNLGMEKAKGQYIWFVDSDDTVERTSIAVLKKAIVTTDADMILFGINEAFVSANKCTVRRKKPEKHFYKNAKDGFLYLQSSDTLDIAANKIVRNNVIRQSNLRFQQKYIPTEDHIFWLELYPLLGKVAVLDECLYNYFIRDGISSTRKLRYRKFPSYAYSLKLMIKLSEQYQVMHQMDNYLYKMYCYYILWEYEILNHPDCRYGIVQRYRYFCDVFQSNDFERDFCLAALNYYDTSDEIQKVKFEPMVLKAIVNHKYMLPTLISYALNLWGRMRRR